MLSGKLIVPEPDIYEGYTVKKSQQGYLIWALPNQ
jgi:hypothetical protein